MLNLYEYTYFVCLKFTVSYIKLGIEVENLLSARGYNQFCCELTILDLKLIS